jgi:hypothetical protein
MNPTGTTTTVAARLRGLADLLDAHPGLPPVYDPRFSFFARTMDQAVALRDVMTDPVVAAKDDVNFPAEIRGTLAGFPVVVFIDAEANPVTAPVPLPQLDPRLTTKTPAPVVTLNDSLCDFCSESITGTPVVDPDERSWVGIGAAQYCSTECREAADEARVNAAGGV